MKMKGSNVSLLLLLMTILSVLFCPASVQATNPRAPSARRLQDEEESSSSSSSSSSSGSGDETEEEQEIRERLERKKK